MPDLLLLLQLLVVLAAVKALGWLGSLLRQPPVVGEMAAGIVLGPTLLGWVAPDAARALFPPSSLGALHSLSQIGLLLFMFVLGLKMDARELRGHTRSAAVISSAGIVIPFSLSILLAVPLHPVLAPPGVGLKEFALFLGAAISVTAFPVLARILTDQGLLGTRIGTFAIASAAVDDVAAPGCRGARRTPSGS